MIISNMTMNEFTAGLEKTRTVLVPFGSTEEHGTHLPLDTDTLHASEVGRKLAEVRDIFIAPPIHYGVCRSTFNHPGTLSISTETLKVLTLDVVSALYRQGLRNFVLISGHAGGTHMATLTDAGEMLLQQYPDIKIAVLTEYMIAAKVGKELIETDGDSHAGEIETSRMLHSHPQLVKGTAEREFPDFPVGMLVRDKQKYWPGGVWGDPGKASAEKGAKLEKLVVQELNTFVDRMENWQE
ncbi:creatinine amidohydrolase [Malonomonas rubra DSM 5091]|uniref:Creatinine amidohydrolase n=1 Tax=Malonomonas rubra DSM 5091 TaxID=1122189 RepID=A0A1M6K8R7_MALRU|nr:creatininase family protein [Malonomonas rubra]SHJ55250.1 creatinine amidohydrolase [Malonomonas rubra DSM 5091]